MNETTGESSTASPTNTGHSSLPPGISNFWSATHRMWLTKAFAPFGNTRASKAAKPIEEFLLGEVVTSRGLQQFLAACPPLPEEFLIGWDGSSDPPDFVLTNQRLWIRTPKTGAHTDIRLKDVFGWESGSPIAGKVAIKLRDKTLLQFDGLAATPEQELLGLAVRRSTKQHEWGTPLATPAPRQPPAQPPQQQYSGVGGWLLFLCVGLTVFAPAITLISVAALFIDYGTQLSRFPDLLTVTTVDIILSLAMTAFSVYAGVGLWRIQPGAVKTAKRYLSCLPAYLIVSGALPFMVHLSQEAHDAVVVEVVKAAVTGIPNFIIWYLYLNQSKRVKATYARLAPLPEQRDWTRWLPPLAFALAAGAVVAAVCSKTHAIPFQLHHYTPTGIRIPDSTGPSGIVIFEFRGPRKAAGTSVPQGRYLVKGTYTPANGEPLVVGFSGGRTYLTSYNQVNTPIGESGKRLSFKITFRVDSFQPSSMTPELATADGYLDARPNTLPHITSVGLPEFGQAGSPVIIQGSAAESSRVCDCVVLGIAAPTPGPDSLAERSPPSEIEQLRAIQASGGKVRVVSETPVERIRTHPGAEPVSIPKYFAVFPNGRGGTNTVPVAFYEDYTDPKAPRKICALPGDQGYVKMTIAGRDLRTPVSIFPNRKGILFPVVTWPASHVTTMDGKTEGIVVWQEGREVFYPEGSAIGVDEPLEGHLLRRAGIVQDGEFHGSPMEIDGKMIPGNIVTFPNGALVNKADLVVEVMLGREGNTKRLLYSLPPPPQPGASPTEVFSNPHVLTDEPAYSFSVPLLK